MAQAITDSGALEQLKDDLTAVAKNLHSIHDLLLSQMNELGNSWEDDQYQQFVNGYKPQIEKCGEIANRYDYGCNRFLAPQIENVRTIEHTDVSESGGSVGGNASGSDTDGGLSAAGVAGVAGAAGIAGAAGGIGMASLAGKSRNSSRGANTAFNMGIDRGTTSVPPAKNQAEAQAKWEEQHQMSLDTEHYYIDENGNVAKKPVGYNGGGNTSGESGSSERNQGETNDPWVSVNEPGENGENGTTTTYNKVCTENGVDVYGTGAHGKTCETTYEDGSKKIEVETCTQTGVSVSGLGGVGAHSTVEGCTVTEKNIPAPSDGNETGEGASGGVVGSSTAETAQNSPVGVVGGTTETGTQMPSETSSMYTSRLTANDNPGTSGSGEVGIGQIRTDDIKTDEYPARKAFEGSKSDLRTDDIKPSEINSAPQEATIEVKETTVNGTVVNGNVNNAEVSETTVNKTAVNNTVNNNVVTAVNENKVNVNTENTVNNIVINKNEENHYNTTNIYYVNEGNGTQTVGSGNAVTVSNVEQTAVNGDIVSSTTQGSVANSVKIDNNLPVEKQEPIAPTPETTPKPDPIAPKPYPTPKPDPIPSEPKPEPHQDAGMAAGFNIGGRGNRQKTSRPRPVRGNVISTRENPREHGNRRIVKGAPSRSMIGNLKKSDTDSPRQQDSPTRGGNSAAKRVIQVNEPPKEPSAHPNLPKKGKRPIVVGNPQRRKDRFGR